MPRILRCLPGLLLLLPSLLHAQLEPAAPRGRVVLSGITGVRVPFTTGQVLVRDSAGRAVATPRQERGGNPVVGVEARARFRGPVDLVATGMYSQAGTGRFVFGDSSDDPAYEAYYGSNTLFARAGFVVRVAPPVEPGERRVRPSTDVSLAAAVVRDLGVTHPAVNAGFQGALPIGRAVELVLGLEDYLVFWNNRRVAPQLAEILGPATGVRRPTATTLYDTSHILTLRAGISLHYR